jgi:hypothetical protein
MQHSANQGIHLICQYLSFFFRLPGTEQSQLSLDFGTGKLLANASEKKQEQHALKIVWRNTA